MKDFTNRTKETNERIRETIETWLDREDKGNRCPFTFPLGGENCNKLCEQIFPRLDGTGCCCPCNNYSLKYVIRIAKQAIKALE